MNTHDNTLLSRQQNDALAYVECRLEEWADWYSRGCDLGLGYPRQSTIAGLLDNQGVLTKAQGRKPLPTHERSEEIEAFIIELVQQNSRIAKALCQFYLGKGSMTQKARVLGISYAYFKMHVDMAKQWLAGRLTSQHR
jgi:hypothetical protein